MKPAVTKEGIVVYWDHMASAPALGGILSHALVTMWSLPTHNTVSGVCMREGAKEREKTKTPNIYCEKGFHSRIILGLERMKVKQDTE